MRATVGQGKFSRRAKVSLPEPVKISDSFFVQSGKLADIGPGGKTAALSEEKKGFYLRVRFVFLQTGFEILQDLAVDRIESLGSVQRDPEDVAILLKQNQRHFGFPPPRFLLRGIETDIFARFEGLILHRSRQRF